MSSGHYINPTNKAPVVKTGHTLWFNSFYRFILGEILKSFFSETIYFSMEQHLVLHNIDPANQALESKLATPCGSVTPIYIVLIMGKALKP